MNDESINSTSEVKNETKCSNCGSALKFEPGSVHLKCQHCGTENSFVSEDDHVWLVEEHYLEFFDDLDDDQKEQIHTVACTSCGAASTLKPNVTSDNCPFCDTPLVVSSATTTQIIKPQYLLPFAIDNIKAIESFKAYIKSLWFAPNDLKMYAENPDRLNGVYIPYWTYNSSSITHYTGERGIDREEETQDGKTKTVTDWHECKGNLLVEFDDVLVLGSKSLPEKNTYALEPWDLENIVHFNEKFLIGFRTETYQIDVKAGFEKAQEIMEPQIRKEILKTIGGDKQRIKTMDTKHDEVTFKHILLPIWISAFRIKNKTYRFVVNGRTGEVQSERPWSWVKIGLAVLAVSTIGCAVYFIFA